MWLQIGLQMTFYLQPLYWERGRLVPKMKLQTTTHLQPIKGGGKRIRDATLHTFIYHYIFAAKSKSLII